MANITHPGFRRLVHEFGGCDLYFSEMISSEALANGTPNERYYLNTEPCAKRTILQLVGYSHSTIIAAARRVLETDGAGVDLNFGCSAPQIVRKGGGIAWMKDLSPAVKLISELRDLLPDRSLSAKLRLGAGDNVTTFHEFAKGAEEAGVDFITLHPKGQKDRSARAPRWNAIEELAAELCVPVIGNGGVVDFDTYNRRSASAAAGIMIGRSAVRAPWLFSHIRRREADPGAATEIDLLAVLDGFFALMEETQPRDFWSSRARRFYPYFFRNLPFGHTVGTRLGYQTDYQKGRTEARKYFDTHPESRIHIEK